VRRVGSSQFAVRSYPNPFVGFTTLEYELEHSANVNLSIYNYLGQQVVVLADGKQAAGRQQVRWDAEGIPAGIYFYRLAVSGQRSMGRS
jgi:flagellar hook assembly protein FlgD